MIKTNKSRTMINNTREGDARLPYMRLPFTRCPTAARAPNLRCMTMLKILRLDKQGFAHDHKFSSTFCDSDIFINGG